MRRADRLFQIVQIMQRRNTVTTARDIAQELEVSERTVYRDIQDLMANRVPIRGERGMGYMLEKGYDLPPLMFNAEEIDALMLGVSWVQANGDPHIQRAAEDILAKVESVLPEDRQRLMGKARQVVPKIEEAPPIRINMPVVRQTIRDQKKAKTRYTKEDGTSSERIVYPLLTVFFQNIQLLVCWCELRQDFRNFRMDRFDTFEPLDEVFSSQIFQHLGGFLARQRNPEPEE